MTSSSVSAVRNAPGISTIATYQFSDASIAVVINTESVDTVGDVASDFLGFFAVCCHPRTWDPLLFHGDYPLATLVPVAHLHATVERVHSSWLAQKLACRGCV